MCPNSITEIIFWPLFIGSIWSISNDTFFGYFLPLCKSGFKRGLLLICCGGLIRFQSFRGLKKLVATPFIKSNYVRETILSLKAMYNYYYSRLLDITHGQRRDREMSLHLIFEHIHGDLDTYLKKCPPPGLSPDRIKV